MKLIRTKYFDSQFFELKKKYPRIEYDLEKFENIIEIEPFSDLGYSIYKYRIRNSSIPTGKRGGFRIIIKKINDKYLPILIYSKTIKENVSDKEIIIAFEKVLEELKN